MSVKLQEDDDTRELPDTDLGLPDGDPETVYIIRNITQDVSREITKRHTSRALNRRTHQFDERVDWEAVSDDLLDYCLVDWKGVKRRGEPAPCVLENKLRLGTLRIGAIRDAAGMVEIERSTARKEESFRKPPAVVPAVD